MQRKSTLMVMVKPKHKNNWTKHFVWISPAEEKEYRSNGFVRLRELFEERKESKTDADK